MSTAAFQKKVLSYSHLPTVFLLELSKVADRIPEEKRTEILSELDSSAERELSILAEGYRLISEAEKKLRKEAEGVEHAEELNTADTLLTQSSNPSL